VSPKSRSIAETEVSVPSRQAEGIHLLAVTRLFSGTLDDPQDSVSVGAAGVGEAGLPAPSRHMPEGLSLDRSCDGPTGAAGVTPMRRPNSGTAIGLVRRAIGGLRRLHRRSRVMGLRSRLLWCQTPMGMKTKEAWAKCGASHPRGQISQRETEVKREWNRATSPGSATCGGHPSCPMSCGALVSWGIRVDATFDGSGGVGIQEGTSGSGQCSSRQRSATRSRRQE
jgi:hypothetical protein